MIFIIALCLLTLLRFWFTVRYRRFSPLKAFVCEPVWLVLFRWVTGCALLYAVYDVIWGTDPLAVVSIPAWLIVIGILMIIDALALLAWSHSALRERFSTTIGTDQVTTLVQSGPYRYLRHPMYLAYIWYFLGLFCVSGSILVSALGLSIILSLVMLRLPYEEQQLMRQFPHSYARYKQQTRAFIPRIFGFRDT